MREKYMPNERRGTVIFMTSSLAQAHYMALSDAARVRAPPGAPPDKCTSPYKQLLGSMMLQVKSTTEEEWCCYALLPLLVLKHLKKKKKDNPLASDSSCLPLHSGELDVNGLLLLARCCCDTQSINKLWSPPGYLKVLCTCLNTCTHTTGKQKPRSCD